MKTFYFGECIAFTWILIWWKHTFTWFLRDIMGNSGKVRNNTHGRLEFFIFIFFEITQFNINVLAICLFLLNWRKAVCLYLVIILCCINWLATLTAILILSKAFWLYSLNYNPCLRKHTLYNYLLLADSMHTVCNIYCICQVFKRPLGVLINVS